ncbi:hypothetical protein ZIOFF_011731 [Zingiber officinale]|uniref:Eukaryotic translation initiation factor 4B2 n=1 Tax=Zingiber officinale TaxID=94328 RepID=A0A8J5HMN8_ZINOF|nr:hypothetical protein ZIOFF_011731 [Zingiber officinale]
MSKAWGGVGAWALDAEQAEAEERERMAADMPPPNSLLAGESAQSFPSLKEAATSSKQKKKKGVTIPLAQFNAGSLGAGTGGRRDAFEPKGLTPSEMSQLPTGPRERSQEELEQGRFGGGFRGYGGGGGVRGGFPNRRSDEADGSWGGDGGGRRGYGGFNEDQRRGPNRASDFDQPSRADEVDNWGSGKKAFAPQLTEGGRRDSYSFVGGGSSSRADEVDNWASAKKTPASNYPSSGSRYGDSRTFSDSDRWGRDREGSIPNDQRRQKIILDPPKRDVAASSEPPRTRPSPFGAARPREEILAEKGLDWKRLDSDIEIKKTSRPTSSHSSRPSSAQSNKAGSPRSQSVSAAAEVTVKSRPKTNPFGDAKPREILLDEKGIDWRKIDKDLEHRSVERPETDEEKVLKEEIDKLKALTIEAESDINSKVVKLSSEELSRLHEEIANKERDLELIACQLNDKVRFGQKVTANSRPGSAAGRSDTSSARPPSRSGMSESSKSVEFVDAPQSISGTEDAWRKPMNDRRGLHVRRDRGFFDNRNGNSCPVIIPDRFFTVILFILSRIASNCPVLGRVGDVDTLASDSKNQQRCQFINSSILFHFWSAVGDET